MLIPKYIKAKNLLSFESFIYYFKQETTTCVMGENLTDSGQKSNGSGKSAIQNAMELAYKGDFSRKINKSKIVRRGEKELEIECCSYNNVKDEYLLIHRTIPVKGSEKVKVYLYRDVNKFNENNDKFKIDIASTNDANNWIIDYIGISKEDLSNYFFPNELTYKSFFDASDTQNKALIGRFSNSEVADKAFVNIDMKLKGVNSEIVEKEKELLRLETTLENRQEDLSKEKDRDLKQEQQDQIDDIKSDIGMLRYDIKEYLSSIDEYLKKKKSLSRKSLKTNNVIEKSNKKIKDYINSGKNFDDEYKVINEKVEKVEPNIKEADKLKDDISEDISSVRSDIRKVENSLSGTIECPNCHHKFILKSDFTVEELNKQLEEFKQEMEDFAKEEQKANDLYLKYKEEKSNLLKEGDKLRNKRVEFDKGLRLLEDKHGTLQEYYKDLVEKNKSIDRKVDSLNEQIDLKKESIEFKEGRIEEIENQDLSKLSKEKELKKEVNRINKLIEEKDSEIQTLQLEVERLNEWTNYFKSFKSFLANKKLKIIEGMMNKFLVDMECDYQIKLEGYKQLGSGEIREKITPYIFKDGQICGFHEFSKGERTRMNMANLLTLQTLINETSKTGGLALLFPDEIFEGLDSEGLNLLLKSSENTNKTVLITTHVLDDKIHENMLMIRKINGISEILN